ncbi:hypothetical protein [Salirhabdus salicampi]|uniref:hypothetical protein n=1 Tax=Salirhabdus salicampi TaxID=476102 RepID=UPI0020C1DADC|nr:hypothetical protein [Salirhabdus salicampi]MCP8615563.1 hypothetical protein [Salirhabdus salicampi]
MYPTHSKQELLSMCKSHINKYVLLETADGGKFDGIIIDVDTENVTLAVPIGSEHMQFGSQNVMMDRQWGYPYPYWNPHNGYPGGRFQRLVIPLAALTALTLLPWF